MYTERISLITLRKWMIVLVSISSLWLVMKP